MTSPYISIYTRLVDAVVDKLCNHPHRKFWDALQQVTGGSRKFSIYYNALHKNERDEFEKAVMARVKARDS